MLENKIEGMPLYTCVQSSTCVLSSAISLSMASNLFLSSKSSSTSPKLLTHSCSHKRYRIFCFFKSSSMLSYFEAGIAINPLNTSSTFFSENSVSYTHLTLPTNREV
eukprot:TRINITY_DN13836_c0_g2_i1.p1 TRINITY_DN13836_c0_g2~~TRINITY_DN13836_c0_g2_i1.p1  ORF type:complete len:107 (-),score=9.39 TRINITY_DN13836_c0_g2_i1:49-369(-)